MQNILFVTFHCRSLWSPQIAVQSVPGFRLKFLVWKPSCHSTVPSLVAGEDGIKFKKNMCVWLSFLLFSMSWWCVTQNMHLSHTLLPAPLQILAGSYPVVHKVTAEWEQWGKLRKDKQIKLSALEFLISRAWNKWAFSVLPGFLAVPFSSPGSGPHHHPHGAVPLLLLRSLGFALSLWASRPDHDKCFPSQLRGKGKCSLGTDLLETRRENVHY